ncbi:MAG: V-type ATPase subunit [Candidatus Schekmanbacteria bacterium]|nr:V-type ATPase subunit [Candidatus Schekmanbacteria bacterium]
MINISYSDLSSDPRYAFAVGKIRALETNLITNQQVNRLLETKDANALWSELGNNRDYEAHLAQFYDPQDFEAVLSSELKRVYALTLGISAERTALELLALRHDFHNCKVISKACFLGEDTDSNLSPLGTCPPKEWEQLMVAEKEAGLCRLPADLMQIVRDVQQQLIDEQNLRRRDIIWDQALYQYLSRHAEKSKNLFVQTWLKIRIDGLNLLTYVRCIRQKSDKGLLKLALIDSGTIACEKLQNAYEGGLETLASLLSPTPYAGMIQEGLACYKRDNSFSCLEKLFDDYEMEFLSQARYVSLGVEPLFAYLLAKETEIKVLRILLVGKINRLDKTEISKRVRRLYA